MLSLVLILSLIVIGNAQAADVVRIFQWDQPQDLDITTHWVLYWGDKDGGPYDIGSFQINKTNDITPIEAQATIVYPDNAITTYYFVVVAFNQELFSGNSNQVALQIDTRNTPSPAVNLRVTIPIQ